MLIRRFETFWKLSSLTSVVKHRVNIAFIQIYCHPRSTDRVRSDMITLQGGQLGNTPVESGFVQ